MENIKITFVGDIMCEPLMLKAAKAGTGTYDFDGVFKYVKPMLQESDYVIGNLETPLAGKKARYVHELFSFNAPDEFADAVKKAGIDFVTTANNHCLDRGVTGLTRTIDALEEKKIAYTGTCAKNKEKAGPEYFRVGEVVFGIVSYTSSTNFALNHVVLDKNDEKMVNLLGPQRMRFTRLQKAPLYRRFFKLMLKPFKLEHKCYIKKALHMTYASPYTDDYVDEALMRPYIERMTADIREASERADVVLFFPHMGGQFNDSPGVFSQYVAKKAIEAGCDVVVGSHPHVVQKAELIEGKPCFYSLGNFSMSPNSIYLVHKNLPDYGIALHVYVENEKIARITFSILNIVETKNSILTVYPIDIRYREADAEEKNRIEKNVKQIYEVVTGGLPDGDVIQKEYPVYSFS